ncbi:WD40 repeat-like protein, partial [Pluteus cervinus]
MMGKDLWMEAHISFADIVKSLDGGQHDAGVVGLKGPQGETISLDIEVKLVKGLLDNSDLPVSVLERLGPAQQLIEILVGISDQLGDINPIVKAVSTIFSKIYGELENQKKTTEQLALLFDLIGRLLPLFIKAQDLNLFDSLQKVTKEILGLIEESLYAISRYNHLGITGQLLDPYKKNPVLDVQGFSSKFETLYKVFDTSLQVDQAYYQDIKQTLALLDPVPSKLTEPCLLGTCSDILQDLDTWTTQPSAEKIFWLYGVAGAGKSTISASFAKSLGKQLGGYHTCSRDDIRLQSPIQLVKNLCYQLSLACTAFARQVVMSIKADRQFSSREMPVVELFELLFKAPLSKMTSKQSFVLIVDALDECGDIADRDVVLQQLGVIVESCSWLEIFLTSRPIVAVDKILKQQRIIKHSLNLDKTSVDINHFFKFHFQPEKEFEFEGDWDILMEAVPKLTDQAGGLFIWAQTAYHYLKRTVNKASGIQELLEAGSSNLYDLYTKVLNQSIAYDSGQSNDNLKVYQAVMTAILLASAPLSEEGLAGLLFDKNGLSKSTIKRMLSRLKGLIYVGQSNRIYTIHPSFREYLVDSLSCPKVFHISKQGHAFLLEKTVNVLVQQLRFNICNISSSFQLNNEILDLSQRISTCVSEELRYSAQYWIKHMIECQASYRDYENLLSLLIDNEKVIYWMEVISILSCVREIMVDFTRLVENIGTKSSVARHMSEIVRFLHRFISPISQSVCHIYLSCLAFVPGSSWMATLFWPLFPNRVQVQNIMNEDWKSSKGHTMILENHQQNVQSVAFSPDGKYVVSGSWDKTVRIWEVETGQQKGPSLQGHEQHVSSVAFSPDGRYMVSGSWDRTIKIWEIETGQQKGSSLEGHVKEVSSVAFSPDGQYVASGSWDKTVKVWNIETGQQKPMGLQSHNDRVYSIAFSQDGRYVVSGSKDKTVRIWEVATGQQKGGNLKGHNSTVHSVSFSPNGKYVVSGSQDKTVRIWEVETGQQKGTNLKGHDGNVTSVVFSPDGNYVISGSFDQTVRIWEVATGQQKGGNFQGHRKSVNSVACSPDGRYVVSGSWDNTVRIWNIESSQQTSQSLLSHNGPVNSVVFSPDGQYVASGSFDKTVRIWEIRTGQQKDGTLLSHDDSVLSVAFSPDGKYVVSGSQDKTMRVWEVATGQQKSANFEGHDSAVYSVAFSSDGKYVVSGSDDNTVRIWEVETGQQKSPSLEGHDNCVNSVSFSPDGKHVVSGSQDNTVRIWEVETGQQKCSSLQGHGKAVYSVAFSPDGKYVVSGSEDHTVRIWD